MKATSRDLFDVRAFAHHNDVRYVERRKAESYLKTKRKRKTVSSNTYIFPRLSARNSVENRWPGPSESSSRPRLSADVTQQ